MALPIIGVTKIGRVRRAVGAIKRSRAYRAAAPAGRKVKAAGAYAGGKAKAGYKAATKTRTRKIITGSVLGAGAAGGGYAAYRKRKRSRARKSR